jgi:hypothetical protein
MSMLMLGWFSVTNSFDALKPYQTVILTFTFFVSLIGSIRLVRLAIKASIKGRLSAPALNTSNVINLLCLGTGYFISGNPLLLFLFTACLYLEEYVLPSLGERVMSHPEN